MHSSFIKRILHRSQKKKPSEKPSESVAAAAAGIENQKVNTQAVTTPQQSSLYQDAAPTNKASYGLDQKFAGLKRGDSLSGLSDISIKPKVRVPSEDYFRGQNGK